METISRINRRAAWLALVAAAFAAPALAQTNNDDLLPARPLAAPHWPEFAPPADASKPDPAKNAATTTSANLPAFSGFGAGGNAPKAGAFPQPGINAPATTDTNSGKVWTVAGQDKPASPPERNPRDFGNGWKNIVANKMAGRPGPAAALATPRSTSTPRPEWNWHGYDSYNINRATSSELPAANSPSNAADLAPFMKYAHLWRPATLAGGTHTAGNNQSGPAPLVPPAVYTPTPSAPPVTPGITTPLDDAGRPAPLIQSEFRAPPSPIEPPKPRVVYAPMVEAPNQPPLAVRQKLSEVCAGKCRNLAVETSPGNRLRVAFRVRDQVEADLLTNLVGGLPELAPYKVDFEVQIGQ